MLYQLSLIVIFFVYEILFYLFIFSQFPISLFFFLVNLWLHWLLSQCSKNFSPEFFWLLKIRYIFLIPQ